MPVQPYLFFDGQCEDAIAFYETAVKAERLGMMRFSESPDPIPEGMVPPGQENRIMHASLRIAGSEIMLSDGCPPDKSAIQGFSLAIMLPDVAETERAFAALSEGGQVGMPLMKTFFSPSFGMLTDRFGVPWMILTAD